jgi:molybdopterin-guanine dinucleotide biosynthesis protein A
MMIHPALSVAIMAGGKSSRMGTDKAFVPFEGRPLIETVIEQVTGLGEELILIANQPEQYAHIGVPIFGDVYPDHGPLGGIYTAVHHARHPHTLIVACDMPWLNRSLLEYMISLRETADIIVPRWEQFPEPLHAIYNKACLPPIETNLKAQRLKITTFFSKVSVRFVSKTEIQRFDSDGRSFANINTPDDLARGKKKS